jgi:hypothetical protein
MRYQKTPNRPIFPRGNPPICRVKRTEQKLDNNQHYTVRRRILFDDQLDIPVIIPIIEPVQSIVNALNNMDIGFDKI